MINCSFSMFSYKMWKRFNLKDWYFYLVCNKNVMQKNPKPCGCMLLIYCTAQSIMLREHLLFIRLLNAAGSVVQWTQYVMLKSHSLWSMTYSMPQFWFEYKCVFVESAGVVFCMFTILTYFRIRTRHIIR